jgi:hypothetical protein
MTGGRKGAANPLSRQVAVIRPHSILVADRRAAVSGSVRAGTLRRGRASNPTMGILTRHHRRPGVAAAIVLVLAAGCGADRSGVADPAVGVVPGASTPAAPLQAGLRPADAASLLGRWVPDESAGPPPRVREGHAPLRPRRAFVELSPGGRWAGSDGCNGVGGRWIAGADGALFATAGPQTLIGCLDLRVDHWLTGSRQAGFDGDVLVLLDAAGHELGRLRRA